MLHRIKTLAALAFLCLAPTAMAGGKSDDAPVISFHIETEATDNPKMTFPLQVGGQLRYFRLLSEVSSRDIAAFGPFPDNLGGDTYGVALQLKPSPARRLAAVTAVSQGKWLVARVNGLPRDAVIIDKEIDDGYLIIWKGITLQEINTYDKMAPRIGAKDDKKKKND
jgi:hypothetical protein